MTQVSQDQLGKELHQSGPVYMAGLVSTGPDLSTIPLN